ncbi:hypothetical protein I302_105501 [Kwoniella bestiolae CBS 10118]|uniref:HSF-type DNA-binding domain-containing protein n=1 Tax=Kwoniella bestiolae CBS 10118 TaxID=1296100 RepID=A0A1B9FTA9_9TREE|nr:hypothetical protein I302_08783 [Kwoniella bestiolae CBS 10118]OCF22002.1 hypothetical protein I302_08783 [Kwoniella bestiolae CBS 10118]
MTTNLYAVAGPSKPSSIVSTVSSTSPKSEPPSPLKSLNNPLPTISTTTSSGVSKPGMSLDENGEVLKVPAFLNKLYTMVSDESVNELIYWADNGDSFFVPNAEQFGRELLPRWFKHSNFSSFVRQLNMYGFHKVPHLQSGALKNETPVELWEFANPFFKRGQPDLLVKVTRKNNRPGTEKPPAPSTGSGSLNTRSATQAAAATTAPPGKYLITDGSVEGEANQLVGPPGQVLDINAIHSGIAAIRQTQATIGADLRKLQASNEALWRQAYETQEKQRKHGETIDLIVSFLEQLFGTQGEGLKGLKEAMKRGGLGRPREDSGSEENVGGSAKKRKRMGIDRMIQNGPSVDDEDDDDRLVEIGSTYSMPTLKRSATTPESWSSSAQRFTTLPTEDDSSTPTGTSRAASKGLTPGAGEQTLGTNHLSPLSDTDHLLPSDNNALARYNAPNPQFNQQLNLNPQSSQPLLSPTSAEAAASAYNLDPSLLQTTIGSLIQSPAAAQMFLNSLNNSVQGQALQSTKPTPQPTPQQNQNQTQNQNYQNPINGLGDSTSLDPTLALFSPLPNQDSLMQSTNDLMKSYQDAVGVNGGVDQLQESIDSLVRSMGLDLPNGQNNLNGDLDLGGVNGGLPNGNVNGGDGTGLGGQMGTGTGEQLIDPDFNVDEFLEHLAKGDNNDESGMNVGAQGNGGF